MNQAIVPCTQKLFHTKKGSIYTKSRHAWAANMQCDLIYTVESMQNLAYPLPLRMTQRPAILNSTVFSAFFNILNRYQAPEVFYYVVILCKSRDISLSVTTNGADVLFQNSGWLTTESYMKILSCEIS